MKRRKFADGGSTPALDEIINKGGKFSEETYRKARQQVEGGGEKEEAKSAVNKARKVEIEPTASETKVKTANRVSDEREYDAKPGEIPKPRAGTFKAPASTGEDTSGPSNLSRILSAGGAGVGALGTAAALRTAGHADRVANRVAKAISSANASGRSTAPTMQVAKSAEKFSPKQQMEAAESTMRGAANRAAVRAKRSEAEADAAKMAAKEKPSSKIADTLGGGGGRVSKADEASRVRFNRERDRMLNYKPGRGADEALPGKKASYADDMDVEYKKGGTVKKYAEGGMVGSASRRADGIATKGKTKCKIY